jgi:hypothetical protein
MPAVQPLSKASCPATTFQRTDASRPTTWWKTTASGSATAIHLPFGDQSAYRPLNVRGAGPWKQPRQPDLDLVRRRGSRRSTVSRLLGRRPVTERVRERNRADRDHSGCSGSQGRAS